MAGDADEPPASHRYGSRLRGSGRARRARRPGRVVVRALVRQEGRALVPRGRRDEARRPPLRRDEARDAHRRGSRPHVRRRPLRVGAVCAVAREAGALGVPVRLPRARLLGGHAGSREGRGRRHGSRSRGAQARRAQGRGRRRVARRDRRARRRADDLASARRRRLGLRPRRDRGRAERARRPRRSCASRRSISRPQTTGIPPYDFAAEARELHAATGTREKRLLVVPGRCTARSWSAARRGHARCSPGSCAIPPAPCRRRVRSRGGGASGSTTSTSSSRRSSGAFRCIASSCARSDTWRRTRSPASAVSRSGTSTARASARRSGSARRSRARGRARSLRGRVAPSRVRGVVARDGRRALPLGASTAGFEIENEPQEWPYVPGYYATFFRDPDGIKLEVVFVP